MAADLTPPAQLQLSCIGQALDVEVPVLPLLARLWLALHLSYSSHSCYGQIRPSTCLSTDAESDDESKPWPVRRLRWVSLAGRLYFRRHGEEIRAQQQRSLACRPASGPQGVLDRPDASTPASQHGQIC